MQRDYRYGNGLVMGARARAARPNSHAREKLRVAGPTPKTKRPAPDGGRCRPWSPLVGAAWRPVISSACCGENFSEACSRAERCGRRYTTPPLLRFVTTNAARPVLSWCSAGYTGGTHAGSAISTAEHFGLFFTLSPNCGLPLSGVGKGVETPGHSSSMLLVAYWPMAQS